MKRQFGIFAVDITEYLSDELREKAGRIFEICVSRLERTHCCEFTPSYFLEPIDYASENRLDDDDDEKMREAIVGSDPFYMHCRCALNLPHRIDEDEYDDDLSLDDAFEEFVEAYSGNPDFDPFVLEESHV